MSETMTVDELLGRETTPAALALADYERATTTLRETFDVLSLKRF